MAEKKWYRVLYRVSRFSGPGIDSTMVRAKSPEDAKRQVELRKIFGSFMVDNRFGGVISVKEVHGVLDFILP